MRTVDKALSLLDFFTVSRPEWGLSELAREAGFDKATTLRLLVSLVGRDLVEQHPESRKYRLGTAVLKLARVREACFPVMATVQPALDRLAAETGETAHASMISGGALLTVGIAEPQRSTRVHLEPTELLPFHATASGIVVLAFAAPDLVVRVLGADTFRDYTENTLRSAQAVQERVAIARRDGVALSDGTFEQDVLGIAAPIFDWSGHAQGAIAVASVAGRVDEAKRQAITTAVRAAAVEVTRALGAEPHPDLARLMPEHAA